jgi:hypothetical protein
MFEPALPTWLERSGHPGDDRTSMLLLVGLFEWLVLALVTVIPIAALAVLADRLWLRRHLASSQSQRARRVYMLIAVVGVAGSVPLWIFAWEHIVVPFENSPIGAAVMLSALFAFGLYSLKYDRRAHD